MSQATIQQRIYAGYGKAAQHIGPTFSQYRCATANNPIAAGNLLRTLPVSFNAEDMGYGRPNKYGKPTWFALVDGTLTQPGDYLVGAQGTFFIAAQQPLLPILAVECNRTLSFARPQKQTQFGAVTNYEGSTPATQTALAANWPASVLQGTKGERNEVGLPGDVRAPWWQILVPAIPGVTFNSSDLVSDELGRRYIISSAELTDLGWRITAQQAQT